MNSTLSSLLSLLLVDRKNGHRRVVLSAYAEKLRVSALSVEEREIYINHKLADLLNHARIHVPRFRALMGKQSAIDASNAREAMASLPVMTRSDIQSDPKVFIAENAVDMFDDATGGSTGTPMRFLVDRTTQIARESSLYWSDSLAGWRYGDRIAMLWGSDKDVKTSSQEAKLAFRWWIDNRRWYNAFNMGEDRMAEFHRELTRFRPHIIVAYAGSLEIYARYLREMVEGSRLKVKGEEGGAVEPSTFNLEPSTIPYPLKALISSAEVLTPEAREIIESVFGKPLFNRYGNREFGAIAAEDGRGGMAVNPTDVILETGEDGELLVTYLNNLVMPFIRYRTGDLVAWSEGQEGRRIEKIHGRSGDTIRTRSGALIHGEYFTHLMYGAKGVKEFQFVQETLDRYRLLVVGEEPTPEVVAHWRQEFADVLGPEANVEIMRVEAIPVLPSGKRKFTVSYMN